MGDREQQKMWHDIENAIHCLEFLSDQVNDGYSFSDEKASTRKAMFAESVTFLRSEFLKLEKLFDK